MNILIYHTCSIWVWARISVNWVVALHLVQIGPLHQKLLQGFWPLQNGCRPVLEANQQLAQTWRKANASFGEANIGFLTTFFHIKLTLRIIGPSKSGVILRTYSHPCVIQVLSGPLHWRVLGILRVLVFCLDSFSIGKGGKNPLGVQFVQIKKSKPWLFFPVFRWVHYSAPPQQKTPRGTPDLYETHEFWTIYYKAILGIGFPFPPSGGFRRVGFPCYSLPFGVTNRRERSL